jgi:hypothetical protein
MDIHPVDWNGEVHTELKSLVGTSHRRFCGPSSVSHIWFAMEPATRNPRTLDPSLTLTRMQYPAIVGKTENTKPFVYAAFASLCKPLQRLIYHS